MSGCVIVTGPPFSICLRKSGTTLPLEPSTLPKRTEQKVVPGYLCPRASVIHSAIAFEAPSAVAGFTALSVETSRKMPAPASAAAVAQTFVPIVLLRTAWSGLSSVSETCL